MNHLRELYRGTILDHYQRPRNCCALAGANRKAEGRGTLCGDEVAVYLKVEHGVISAATFESQGCAIAVAAASLMTEALKGRRIAEVGRLFDGFYHMVTDAAEFPHPELGELAVLAGVRQFPARVECAMLPWHTLHLALRDGRQLVPVPNSRRYRSDTL